MPLLMSRSRPVGRKTKTKWLVPASLVAVAGSSCTPEPVPPCDASRRVDCLPDGGYVCPSYCGAMFDVDGGFRCLC